MVEDDTLRGDVAVQKLDAVMEERQPFAQLQKTVLDLNIEELKKLSCFAFKVFLYRHYDSFPGEIKVKISKEINF